MILSPCTKVCAIDPKTGWCFGCGRTLAEIGVWGRIEDCERARVMAELPARLAELAPAAIHPENRNRS